MVWECLCVCVLVYSTGIVWNEVMCGYANVVHTSSSFCPHTHTHILKPFEDSEPTGLKVDTADKSAPAGRVGVRCECGQSQPYALLLREKTWTNRQISIRERGVRGVCSHSQPFVCLQWVKTWISRQISIRKRGVRGVWSLTTLRLPAASKNMDN